MSTDPVLDDLQAIVPRLRAGDPEALARCYALTADLLASVAVGILRDRDAAEDVVQDVFVRFVGALAELRSDDARAVRAWLVRATRNRCIDRLRSAAHQREERVAAPPDEADTAEAFADPFADEPDPELLAALGELTEDQRSALVLRYVAGLSGAEIGEVLGRNRAAVYQLLRRAERTLRSALERVRSEAAGTSLCAGRRPGGPA